jgi:DNA-binding Xre family transcriptional regulator
MSQQIQRGDGGDRDLSTPRCCRSLGRGLAVLSLFTTARPVLGLPEIEDLLGLTEDLLGLTPATTHRDVTTLLELGHLERNRSRKYQLSLRVLDLARAALGATRLPVHVITALLMARVDELRRPRALSLERLAFASDVSWWTLQRLRSELSDPRLSTLLRLCRGLGVTAGQLLDDLPLPVEPRPSYARTPAQAGTDA